MNRVGLKSLVMAAAFAGCVTLGASVAEAHVSIGVGIGFPAAVAAPPVVVAPPPYYGYYYGPAYYYPPPVAVGPGYWWYDRRGHRHWHPGYYRR